jgi:hypothetical protein
MDQQDYDYLCTDCIDTGQCDDDICPACEGYGYNLTESGRQLLEFLQRRGIAIPMSPRAEEELRGMVEGQR